MIIVTSERLSLLLILLVFIVSLFEFVPSVCVPSSWFCKSLFGSLSFNFKEKFWPCSCFFNHEYEGFLILMRGVVFALFVCHSFLDAMGDYQTEHRRELL